MSSLQEWVAVITGGNGFVGQHIIQALVKHCPEIKEIRVFDKLMYEDKLDQFKPTREAGENTTDEAKCARSPHDPCILSLVGDITDYEPVSQACRGADVVFHVLSLVDASLIPDTDALEKINIEGTRNVVNACLEHNVKQLIYTSTVDVVIGYEDIIHGKEKTTSYPGKFLFESYGETKARAEQLVLDADGKGKFSQLQTISLRPPTIYGEADQHFITQMLRSAKANGGTIVPIGDEKTKFQQAYVGNVAWAHICAFKTLKDESERTQGDLESFVTSQDPVSGKAYFIPDDTPLKNMFVFGEQFFRHHGLTISKYYIPWWLVYFVLLLCRMVLMAIGSIVHVTWNFPVSPGAVRNLGYQNTFFSGITANFRLGYTPIYDYNESLQLSTKYYRMLKL